jgi:transcription elongation factor Elf1
MSKAYCWVECPECKEQTDLNWETLSFAGNFRERVTCSKCGAKIQIIVNVVVSNADVLIRHENKTSH